MKKSQILLTWCIIVTLISTLLLGITGWAYINLKADDYFFCIVLFLSFLGYMGAIGLYRAYLWAKWNDDSFIDMN